MRHADRLVGLLQHQYSSFEALGMHPSPVWCVGWHMRNDVAADVACMHSAAKLAVASSIQLGPKKHMPLSAASSDLFARCWLVYVASNGLVHCIREGPFEHCSEVTVGALDVLCP